MVKVSVSLTVSTVVNQKRILYPLEQGKYSHNVRWRAVKGVVQLQKTFKGSYGDGGVAWRNRREKYFPDDRSLISPLGKSMNLYPSSPPNI